MTLPLRVPVRPQGLTLRAIHRRRPRGVNTCELLLTVAATRLPHQICLEILMNRSALARVASATLAAAVLSPLLWMPSAQAARTVAPDLPDVRRTITVQVDGEWSGEIAFGQLVTGPSRTLRPLPVRLRLTRYGCDLAGCLMTEIQLPESAGVPSSTRIASGLSSAALKPTMVGVIVRRSVGDLVLAEYDATLQIEVMAKRSGPMIRRTTLEQGPTGEVLTVSRIAPVRATVTLGDEIATGTGELVRSQIVD